MKKAYVIILVISMMLSGLFMAFALNLNISPATAPHIVDFWGYSRSCGTVSAGGGRHILRYFIDLSGFKQGEVAILLK